MLGRCNLWRWRVQISVFFRKVEGQVRLATHPSWLLSDMHIRCQTFNSVPSHLVEAYSKEERAVRQVRRVGAQHLLAVAQHRIVFERERQLGTIQRTPVAVASHLRGRQATVGMAAVSQMGSPRLLRPDAVPGETNFCHECAPSKLGGRPGWNSLPAPLV